MRYQVLWIDDDCNSTGRDFIGQAEQDDVDITAFESHEEGINYLEKNIERIDAVILDAKVKYKKEDNVTNLAGLTASRDWLIELKNRRDIPYFIFTGQPDYVTNKIFEQGFGKFYVKGTDDEKIIQDIINAVINKEEYNLKKKYKNVLDSCSEKLLGTELFSKLIAILKNIENNNKLSNSEDLLTPLRKIIERVFEKLGEIGIIPEKILSGEGWINRSSLFLSRKHSEFEHIKEFIPPIVAENFHRLLNITHDASHLGGNLKLKSDQYIQQANSDYLYRSCAYLLLDILLWFNSFVEEHSDIEENKNLWKAKETIQGLIQKDEAGNYFCGKYLLNKEYVNRNYKIGDEIIITEESDNTNHLTKTKYPKYASKYRKK